MSSMKDALLRAGVNPIETALLKALATYLGAGGTVARLNELVAKATDGMSSGGQNNRADKGQVTLASARQPHGDREGQMTDAGDGLAGFAPSSPTSHAQAGQQALAAKAQPLVPAAREPSKADLAAAKTARVAASRSIWDKTIGGEITLRGSTKHHWGVILRKGLVMEHVARRMITEIDWPDDVTPLEEVADEKTVAGILHSGNFALSALEDSRA